MANVWSLFGEPSSSLGFSGQPHLDTVWDIPYSFGPDGFIEHGVDAHIWSSHLLHGKLPDLFEGPRGRRLEAHSMDALVDAHGVTLWSLPP